MTRIKVYKPTQPIKKIQDIEITKEYSLVWIAQNKEQIIKSGNAGPSAATTIYTVPNDKIFYLTGVWIAGELEAANTGISMYLSSAGVLLLNSRQINLKAVPPQSPMTASISYSMPLKINSGESIILSAGALAYGTGGIVGWLEEKKA